MSHVTWGDKQNVQYLQNILYKHLESRWSPPKISSVKQVEWGGLLGLHVECLESTRKPSGLQVDLEKKLAGLPAKENPHGLQLESISPPGVHGVHLESMGECKVLIIIVIIGKAGKGLKNA
jgi:hypothetical protein